MLIAQAPGERIAKAILLAVAVPIGVLLLRSLKLEVRAGESFARQHSAQGT
jgi:hypothetical protein